ncbi:histidine kinase [Streptomyces sulfonofaciens]
MGPMVPVDAATGGPGRPGAPEGPAGGGVVGVVGTKGHVPSLPIQVNALQALCRQLFGFRLAMTALAAPFALTSGESGLAAWLVGSAVLVTFMVSYVLMRDWERFGPVLLRHPSLLAADMLFGALLLFTASPNSTLGIVTICTPLLAGLVYSWRGAGIFAALQIVLLAAAYAVNDIPAHAGALLLMGLCVLAGAVGGTLRGLLLRFGAASQALTETRARLAVTEAVEGERARLAREMHDSVAKTLHGLALAADGLASSADRMDPATVKHQAELVARAARRAASESRELLSDLRRASGVDAHVDVAAELAARTSDFARRTGVRAEFRPQAGAALPAVPPAVARQLLTIAAEAMENAHRHAEARHVDVTAGIVGNQLRLSVQDDGRGLPPDTTLDGLRRSGHFGLVGMVERAAGIGARIRIGKGHQKAGTEVRVDLPLAALPAVPPTQVVPPTQAVPPTQVVPPTQAVPPVPAAPPAGPAPLTAAPGFPPAEPGPEQEREPRQAPAQDPDPSTIRLAAPRKGRPAAERGDGAPPGVPAPPHPPRPTPPHTA